MAKISRTALAIILLLISTGCTISPYHVPPDLIIDPAKTPREKLDREEKRRTGGPQKSNKQGDEESVKSFSEKDDSQEKRFVEKFYEAYRISYKEDREPDPARKLTRYGMTLIDTRCDLFFEQIGRGAQTGDFARREFQSITAALIAALGLTNIGKDAITGVGIGSAFGTQSIDNYSTVYFFSPDVSAVQRLVRRAFTSLRTSLLSAEQSPRNFDDALGALRTYQNVCTAHEIKRLVTEAIDEGQTIAQYGNADGPRYAAASGNALKEMAEALEIDILSPRDAAILQLLIEGKPLVLVNGKDQPLGTDETKVDYACEIMSATIQSKICILNKIDLPDQSNVPVHSRIGNAPDASQQEALRAGWATLRALGDAGYNVEVEKQKAVIEASAEKFRKGNIERASLSQKLAAAVAARNESARIEIQKSIDATDKNIAKVTNASEIVSENNIPVPPVTGVTVVPRLMQPSPQ